MSNNDLYSSNRLDSLPSDFPLSDYGDELSSTFYNLVSSHKSKKHKKKKKKDKKKKCHKKHKKCNNSYEWWQEMFLTCAPKMIDMVDHHLPYPKQSGSNVIELRESEYSVKDKVK